MPKTLAEVTAEALALSDDDRAALAETLWDSLPEGGAVADEAAYDPGYVADLRRRIDAARSGTSGAVPWAEVRRRVEAEAATDAPG
jgi:putative addiction module component (TIGR02574 family)